MAGEKIEAGRHPLMEAFVQLFGRSPESLMPSMPDTSDPAVQGLISPFRNLGIATDRAASGVRNAVDSSLVNPIMQILNMRFGGDRVSDQSLSDLIAPSASAQERPSVTFGPSKPDIELSNESEGKAKLTRAVGRGTPKVSAALKQPEALPNLPVEGLGASPFAIDSQNFEQGMGTAPTVSTEDISSLMPDTRPFEERHPLWSAFLGGITESIVPAVVSFAAQYSDNPGMVVAWSQQEANRIEQEKIAAEEEIAQLKAFMAHQQAEREYQNQILTAQRSLMGEVRNISTADNMPPLAKVTALAALAPQAALLGVPAQMLSDLAGQVVAPQIRNELKSQYDAALKMQQISDPKDPRWHSIVPIQLSDGSAYTLAQAANILGLTDENGTLMPNVSDIEVRESMRRDASGRETVTVAPTADLIGVPQVRERTPQAGDFQTEVVPGENEDTYTTFSTTGGGIAGQTTVPRGTTDDPMVQLDALTRRTIREFLRANNRPFTEDDVTEIANNRNAVANVMKWKQEQIPAKRKR